MKVTLAELAEAIKLYGQQLINQILVERDSQGYWIVTLVTKTGEQRKLLTARGEVRRFSKFDVLANNISKLGYSKIEVQL